MGNDRLFCVGLMGGGGTFYFLFKQFDFLALFMYIHTFLLSTFGPAQPKIGNDRPPCVGLIGGGGTHLIEGSRHLGPPSGGS